MRLNKEIREQIVQNAYDASSIPEAKKSLTTRSIALSEKVRIASFKDNVDLTDKFLALEAEFKVLVKKRGIPENYKPSTKIFNRTNSVYVHLGDEHVALRFNGYMEKSRRTLIFGDQVPSKFLGNDGCLSFDANHEFTQEYRSLRDEAVQLQKDEEVLRSTVLGAVNSFNTIEKLVEHWPECEPLIPKDVSKASQPMPIALQTKTLNELIGLPK